MCPALALSTILHVSALAPIWPFQDYYILTKLFYAHALPHMQATAYCRSAGFQRIKSLSAKVLLHSGGNSWQSC